MRYVKTRGLVAALAIGLLLGAGRLAAAESMAWDETPGKVLFSIQTRGGVASTLQELTTLPDFVLYGDGTAIWTRYNHAADLRVVWTAQLTPEEVSEQLAWLDSVGYFGWMERYDDSPMPDMPTTSFTLQLKERNVPRHVYGLAYALKRKSVPDGFGQIQERYTQFKHPKEKLYNIDRVRLFARHLTKLEAKRGFRSLGWGVKQVKLADFARDGEKDYGELDVSGKDAERVVKALKKYTLFSTDLTVFFFKEKKEEFQVGYRPLLPGE
jgi:hypothetical protein